MTYSWTTIDSPDDLRLGEVMPAWFAGRMMADAYVFGLLLTTGQTMLIRRIDAVHLAARAGEALLDVELVEAPAPDVAMPGPYVTAPPGRPLATVNLRHVVAAFEVMAREDGMAGEEE